MEAELSARAVRCRDERLPALLAAVRRRRIGRRSARVALGATCLAACVGAFLCTPMASRQEFSGPALAPVAVAPAPSRIVRDDPTVLARCAVPAVEREDWYLDDQGLQQLLQQAGCDSGLIRAGGRLLAVAAVDALPTAP
ncbi:MAG: hypothetical protein MUC36_25220 [Planctomycetes bacterium]|nr:hypothetical protein [Planctomycetota bacterium]